MLFPLTYAKLILYIIIVKGRFQKEYYIKLFIVYCTKIIDLKIMMMNKNILYIPVLIVLVFTLSLTALLPQYNPIIGQVDPSQEQIEPIPPSNNTNQTAPIVI